MQYRRFGRLDWRVSALGFGAMRLPRLGNDPASVDEPEAVKMIRYAIDRGVNYIDTAYGYHNGRSEVIVGQALLDGYRQKVRIATKLPCWMVQSIEDCDRFLNEQLTRLQVDKINFYLLHGLNRVQWPRLRDLGVPKWLGKMVNSGCIGYLGFSFHDDFDVFKGIIDGYDNWTFCQIQYNYMDVDYQAGTQGLKYAAEKGLGVVVMEPLRGGRLSKVPPESVATLWDSAPQKRSPVEWALQWVWNHPEVSLALSGMSAMNQVVDNVTFAGRSGPNTFSQEDAAFMNRVREAYRGAGPVPCTGCRYCMPCQNGVEIPRIFELFNDAVIYDDAPTARFFYRGASPQTLKESQRADQCIECGECVELCPQHIEIPEMLQKAHELLGPKK